MTKDLKNRILENKVLTHDERMEIIKALEIVEEFEKAQIITGGRLNGRTYAYKRGLEDGKRKALEQQPSDDCVSRQAVIDLINADWKYEGLELSVNELPPVTPTHGVCKDCKHFHNVRKDFNVCDLWTIACTDNHYCADFEKRGDKA